MKKFKLKSPRYSFDHKEMIIQGEQIGNLNGVNVCAGDICDDNIDTMSKMNIRKCMSHGADFKWVYYLDELEPLEPIKVARLDYEMLKFIQKQGAKYICRDKSGILNLFDKSPRISRDDGELWLSTGNSDYLCDFTKQLFKFVTWESQKYYVIEDVLENCEIVED